MKDLRGHASGTVAASVEDCVSLLEAVDQYPRWHLSVIRAVDVLARDDAGRPTLVCAVLRAQLGPLARDLELTLATEHREPHTVLLTRVPHDADDEEKFEVKWQVEEGSPVRIRLELVATLDVPRLVPLGGVGEALAEGFLAAAIAELESHSA